MEKNYRKIFLSITFLFILIFTIQSIYIYKISIKNKLNLVSLKTISGEENITSSDETIQLLYKEIAKLSESDMNHKKETTDIKNMIEKFLITYFESSSNQYLKLKNCSPYLTENALLELVPTNDIALLELSESEILEKIKNFSEKDLSEEEQNYNQRFSSSVDHLQIFVEKIGDNNYSVLAYFTLSILLTKTEQENSTGYLYHCNVMQSEYGDGYRISQTILKSAITIANPRGFDQADTLY